MNVRGIKPTSIMVARPTFITQQIPIAYFNDVLSNLIILLEDDENSELSDRVKTNVINRLNPFLKYSDICMADRTLSKINVPEDLLTGFVKTTSIIMETYKQNNVLRNFLQTNLMDELGLEFTRSSPSLARG